MDYETIKATVEQYKQEHLLQFWDQLKDEERKTLLENISLIDFPYVTKIFNLTLTDEHNKIKDELLEPLSKDEHEGFTQSTEEKLQYYMDKGLEAINNGQVAVILLAGGQGTRLGVNYPKGMYNVGLPSKKSLFHLQAERIRKLEKLASKKSENKSAITWYIMTSEQTKEATEEYFAKHNYFGIEKSNVILFEQGKLPCFTFDGKIILSDKNKIAFAPDGNGGLYHSLKRSGVLADMNRRNIKYVHVYCVDNILVKVCDPIFIGYCIDKQCESGAKVIEKVQPNEALGVICKVEGKYQVVEYSEISDQIASKRKENGRLAFSCGNICNHFFTVDFLVKMADEQLIHHVAKKKIPFVDSDGNQVKPVKPNGIKLEKFVFDVFQYAKHFVVWEAKREEEFSPLKNGESASSDTPTTVKRDLMKLHLNYIKKTGGKIDSEDEETICEISPLLSYAGEDLEELVKDKKLTPPIILYSDEEVTDQNGDCLISEKPSVNKTVEDNQIKELSNQVHSNGFQNGNN